MIEVGGDLVKVLDWEDRFIDILSKSCNVSLAAEGAGVVRARAYARRKESPLFAQRWDTAKEIALDVLEAEAYRRARSSSDVLLIFLLKAHNPDKYREQLQILHGFSSQQLKRLKSSADQYGVSSEELLDKLLSRFEEFDG